MNKIIYMLWTLKKAFFVPTFHMLRPLLRHNEMDVWQQHLYQPRGEHAVESNPNENNKYLQCVIKDYENPRSLFLPPTGTTLDSEPSFELCEDGLRGSCGLQVQVESSAGMLAWRTDKQWCSPPLFAARLVQHCFDSGLLQLICKLQLSAKHY